MLPGGSVFAILDDTEPGGSDRPVTRRSLNIAQATTCTVERAKASAPTPLGDVREVGPRCSYGSRGFALSETRTSAIHLFHIDDPS